MDARRYLAARRQYFEFGTKDPVALSQACGISVQSARRLLKEFSQEAEVESLVRVHERLAEINRKLDVIAQSNARTREMVKQLLAALVDLRALLDVVNYSKLAGGLYGKINEV